VLPESSARRHPRLETDTRPEGERRVEASPSVLGLTIVGHPDLRRIGERAPLLATDEGRETLLSRLEPTFAPPGGGRRYPLADPYLSRRPLFLAPAPHGGVRLSSRGNSASVIVAGEPLVDDRAFSSEEIAAGVVLLLSQRVVLLLHRFQPTPEPDLPSYGLIGESDAMLAVRRQIRQVADLELPVLLRGESGTGKEIVARALHQASRRCDRPYFAVNLAAVPAALAAAELFGAAKGAFTGADRKRQGYFSLAQGGTLFLDEIGEVTPEVQPLLLRVLESGEIQPVGAEVPVRVDVRTIAATDADLEAAIAGGHFRAPLLYRLSGYQICLPPLRERRDDIARLFLHFLRQELAAIGEGNHLDDAEREAGPWLPASFLARLASGAWPGNVRQLRNVARQLAVESRGFPAAQISPQLAELPLDSPRGGRPKVPPAEPAEVPPPPGSPLPAERRRSPMEVSDAELVAALRAHRWHPGATARQLGISRPALYTLIDACSSTRKAADLGPEEIERAAAASGGHIAAMVDLLEVSEEGLKRQIKRLGIDLPTPSRGARGS